MSILLSGEMEVDGDLKVTGTIQASTIDSLLSLIAQLEMRIAQLECQNTNIIPDGYCDCFFHTLDECGVCNGDTTTCQDCAGVPNGDNLQDMCGYCDNDSSNDCVQDCNGEWGGAAVEDVCGDCGGDAENEDECLVYDQDGNAYHTIQIGDQIWLAENLKSSSGRKCYGNDPANCEIYGGLYTWDGAQNACSSVSGWHLASEEEYNELYSLYGGQGSAGSALKDDELWNGTNESGFSALPAGWFYTSFGNGFNYCYIWTSTHDGGSWAKNINISTEGQIGHETRYGSHMNHYFSARCIKE